MHVSTVLSAIHQYVAVNIWSEGGFRQRRSPSSTFVAQPWIHPLEYLAKTTTRMTAFQVKPLSLKLSLNPSCHALDLTHGGSDKKPKHMSGNENFIPTKFHKHPSSGSAVEADNVCSHIYTRISASSPFLHLFKYIKNSLKIKHLNL